MVHCRRLKYSPLTPFHFLELMGLWKQKSGINCLCCSEQFVADTFEKFLRETKDFTEDYDEVMEELNSRQ